MPGEIRRQRPSEVAPLIRRALDKRYALVREYRDQAVKAGEADAGYDAARQARKLKARMLDGVKTNAEAETWADTDPEVLELDLERKRWAAIAKSTQLAIENLADEIRFLNSMLVRERDEDQWHQRFGEG